LLQALDATLKTWWETIPPDHLVDVRYPTWSQW
jgi:hypothetical protein